MSAHTLSDGALQHPWSLAEKKQKSELEVLQVVLLSAQRQELTLSKSKAEIAPKSLSTGERASKQSASFNSLKANK